MRTAEEVSIPALDIEAMQEVLEAAPVDVAVLYGSYARDEASARSDVDVAVGFADELPDSEHLRARLDLMVELCSALERDDVYVVPLATASELLLYDVHQDGVLLLGSERNLDRYGQPEVPSDSHEERMEAFDEILADLERIV